MTYDDWWHGGRSIGYKTIINYPMIIYPAEREQRRGTVQRRSERDGFNVKYPFHFNNNKFGPRGDGMTVDLTVHVCAVSSLGGDRLLTNIGGSLRSDLH